MEKSYKGLLNSSENEYSKFETKYGTLLTVNQKAATRMKLQ